MAQKQYDLFYLCVGSSHYQQDHSQFKDGFKGFANLAYANTSAQNMANLFDSMGARKGLVVQSAPNNFMSQERIFKGLDSLLVLVKKAKAKRPLVVFYYAGHGLSSGTYKAHFIPPGNFADNPDLFTEEQWTEKTIAPLEIREKLQDKKLRHMILLDCCYEGDQKTAETSNDEFAELIGAETLDGLMGDLNTIFGHMETMTGSDPVIFSCQPGKKVGPELYNFGNGKEYTAPLCRRSHRIVKNALVNMHFAVSDFVVMMLSETLDPRTQPGFSTWVMDPKCNLHYMNQQP